MTPMQETRSDWLEMGVFQPLGVQPVHLDLQDAGVTFYFLDLQQLQKKKNASANNNLNYPVMYSCPV